MATLTVLNPTGYPPKVTAKPMAPRLDTLEGKTVYLVDCRFDDSDIFLKQLQGWFADHMPGVRTVALAGIPPHRVLYALLPDHGARPLDIELLSELELAAAAALDADVSVGCQEIGDLGRR